jgi:NAD(P)-dependent dehydrogenase (short-subunit alcohol dehydrogenase family)
MNELTGKTAFITGGAGGMGLGIAKVLKAAGMRVAVSYRRPEQWTQAQAEFGNAGHDVHAIRLDVTDRSAMARAAEEIDAVFGKLHVLVNNAGVSVFGPTDEATYDDYDWIMGVNFGGVVNGLVSFIPRIKAHGEGGHIVNVSSMAAFLPGPQAGIYTASKFAVRGLTECLRDNLAPYNIGVSLMTPALVRTNAFESALRRPARYSNTRFPASAEVAEQMRAVFEVGMDPVEVGEKMLRGIRRNDLYILTHPENKDEFQALQQVILDTWPNEPVDPRREAVEEMRRRAKHDAQTRASQISDLITKRS